MSYQNTTRVTLQSHLVTSLVRRAQQFRFVQGLSGAAKAAFAAVLLGLYTPAAPVIVGLVSFSIYTANDLADLEEDSINCPDHSSFVAAHPKFVALLAGTSLLVGTGIALWAGGLLALAVSLIPFAACLLYSLPVTPSGRRLKDVFVVNTALVAGAWALTVTLVPVTLASTQVGPVTAGVALFFFLQSFASVELFNVRDVDGDAATDVATLPVVIGVPRTRVALGVLYVCSLAVLVLLTAVPHAALPALFALPVVSAGISITWFLEESSAMDVLCLATDGEYVLLGLIALQLA